MPLRNVLTITAASLSLCLASSAVAKTTLNFWYSHGGDSGLGVQACIKEFMKQNPDIIVKPSVVGWDQIQQKLAIAVSAGSGPDVVIFDRFWVGRWTNLLVPLDKYIKRDRINKADYFKAAWDEDCYEGHVYGIPMEASTGSFFLNKKLFDEAGISAVPQTYDDVLAHLVKLTKRDPASANLTQLGYTPTAGWSFFYTYLYAAGGKLVSDDGRKAAINSSEGMAASEWVLKAIDLAGGLGKVNTIFRGGDPFAAGKLAIMIGGSWNVKDYRKLAKGTYQNLQCVVPPSFKGKPRAMMVGGFAAAIPKGSKREADAWRFAKFLGGSESQRIYCTTSWQTPSLKRLFEEPFIQEEKHLKIYADVMENYGWYRPITPVNSQMWDLVNGEMWGQLVNRKKGASELLAWAEREINTHLARYNRKK